MVAAAVSSGVLVLLAAATALAFSPFQTDSAIVKTFLAEGFALVGLAALAVRAGRASDAAARAGLRRALLAIGPLLLAALASAALADFHPLSRVRLEDVAISCAIAALAASAPDPERDARRGALALAVAGALAALYGAAQVAGLDFLRWTGSTARAYLFRSTFGHHSLAAAFLLAAIPPAVALAISRRSSRVTRAVALAAALVLATGLFLSLGRGAWIGFAAAIAVLAALLSLARLADGPAGWRVALAVGAPAVVLAGASLAFDTGAERWASVADADSPSLRSRLLIYEDTLAMIRERPIAGHGIGRFVVEYPRFRSEESHRNLEAGDLVVDHAHDEFLEILAEQGFVGLAAFAFFLGAVALAAIRRLRHGELTALDAGWLASMAGLLVHNLGDVNLRETSSAVPFALAAGFLLRPPSAALAAPAPDPGLAPRVVGALAAAVALVALLRPIERARIDAALMRASLLPPSPERAAELQRVADEARDWPEALYRAGYAQLREAAGAKSDAERSGSLPFAVRDLESLRRLAPYWANMPLPLAQAYAIAKRGADALDVARDFARAHPFDSIGLRFLAELLEKEKKLAEALVAAERGSAAAPFDVDALTHVGRLREALGMNVEASAAFADAAALAPRRADLRLAFARTAVGETQIDEKIEALFIGLQFSRGKTAALNLLSPAIVLLRSPRPDDLRGDYLAGILARFRGDRAEALARYESFATWAGERAEPRVAPAVELAKLGEWDRADALFDEAEAEIWARVDPWRRVELASTAKPTPGDFGAIRDPETRFRLGLELARNGSPDVALELWRDAALDGRPLRLATAAGVAERLGRADEALALREKAAAACESGATSALDDALHGAIREAELSLGKRLDVAGRTPEDLDRRAAARPVDPWDLYLRAGWRAVLGLSAEAAVDYRAVLALDPEHWLALDGLARLGVDAERERAAARRSLASRLASAPAAPPRGAASIAVGDADSRDRLGAGWSRPERLADESLVRWALGPAAEAFVEVSGGDETVEIEAIACEGLAATMTVRVGAVTLGSKPLLSTLQRFRFDLRAGSVPPGPARLELAFDRWASPRERSLGRSPDGWPKAAAVKRIRVR